MFLDLVIYVKYIKLCISYKYVSLFKINIYHLFNILL